MSDDTRPLTDAERRYLEWWLKSRSLKSGPGFIDHLLMTLWGAGCLSFLVYVVMAIVLKILLAITATSAAARAFRSSPWKGRAIFAIPLVLWVAVLVYMFVTRRGKPRPEFPDPKKRVRQDLDGGMARIHRLRAKAVMLAFSEQRRKRNYFVQLEDGKILFLGNWQPLGCKVEGMTFLPDEKGFPSTRFEIAATPNELLILDIVGTGEYLRPTDEFELVGDEDPETDPFRLEPGGLVGVPWEDLKKTFG